ncbi:MAG: T9SS type A sorting domain-containing protein [Dysgonamonadaceae bacterium]|jgi:hypothetical protein|nr:T9SS type A sorting domain-containing protein [Dysgonamonadaceae bacterium]
MKKILLILGSAMIASAALQANANLAGAPFGKAAFSGNLSYGYVTSEWLEKMKYDIDAVSQEIAGNPGSAVSDSATVIISGTGHAATFFFELADSIKSDGTIAGLDKIKFANAGKKIELFHIRNGDQYLTVLDTAISSFEASDSTVTNTQLGWKPETAENSLRQAFAIIYDMEDSTTVTFLPVASCKWKLTTGELPSYGTVLHYNTGVGSVDLSSTWYITGAGQPQRLIIADPQHPASSNPDTVWFKTTLALNLWNGPDYSCDDDSVVGIYQKIGGELYYYSAKGKFHISDDYHEKMAGSIRSHWLVKRVRGNDEKELDRWIFTPEIDTIYGIPQQLVLRDSFIALSRGGDTVELVTTAEKPYKRDLVKIECINNEFSPFMNIEHLVSPFKKVALLETKAGRNFSYDDALPGNSLEAFLKPVEQDDETSYSWLTVYKSNTQYLGKKHQAHEVPYYIFSYTGQNGKEYFLKANASDGSGDSVQWVTLKEKEKEELIKSETWNFPQYKFCLPFVSGGTEEGAVYLQTLDSTQREDHALIDALGGNTGVQAVKFRRALRYSSKEYYEASEGIYSAIDQYKDNMDSGIAGWRIVSEDEIADWVRINAAVDDDNRQAASVFTLVDYPAMGPGVTFIAPGDTVGAAVNYAVLATIGQALEFTLEYRGAAEIGYEHDSIWYYGIYCTDTSDSLYLTDAADSANIAPYAFFTNRADYRKDCYSRDSVYADSLFRQTFALKYVEPANRREHSHFKIVSSADYTKKQSASYRYLSRDSERLIFVDNADLAATFQWGKIWEYTGLKEVGGTPAKIYGTAGGVKVVNVSGAVLIYTIDGRLVTARSGVSANQTIAVPAGIYIVKSGAKVAKVIVK